MENNPPPSARADGAVAHLLHVEGIVHELLAEHLQLAVRELVCESVAEETSIVASENSSNEETIERWCLADDLAAEDAAVEVVSTHEEALVSWRFTNQSIELVSHGIRININTEHRVPVLSWSRMLPLEPPVIREASSASSIPPPPPSSGVNGSERDSDWWLPRDGESADEYAHRVPVSLLEESTEPTEITEGLMRHGLS